MSKPVGVTSSGDMVVVVCEDGSVWYKNHIASDWNEGAPVPDSEDDEGLDSESP